MTTLPEPVAVPVRLPSGCPSHVHWANCSYGICEETTPHPPQSEIGIVLAISRKNNGTWFACVRDEQCHTFDAKVEDLIFI
jgi:hypothetical protein